MMTDFEMKLAEVLQRHQAEKIGIIDAIADIQRLIHDQLKMVQDEPSTHP